MPKGYSLRTKKTVEDGITHVESSQDFQLIEYQPGNATRYVLLLSNIGERLSEASLNKFGASKGSVMVQLLQDPSRPRSIVLGFGEYVDPYYVSERLHVNLADAVVLGELLGQMLSFPHMTCEEFSKS